MLHRILCPALLVLCSGTVSLLAQQPFEMALPVIVNGYVQEPVHLQTTVRVVNPSSSNKLKVTFEAFGNDGKPVRLFGLFPIAIDGTKTVWEIPPYGSVEAFTLGDIPQFNGWARLTVEGGSEIEATAEIALINGPIGPHPICQRPSSEILSTALAPAVLSRNYADSFAVNRPHRQTAWAIVNPSADREITVYLSLLGLDGKLVATAKRSLGPQQRVSETFGQLFENFPDELMGTVWVQSATGVATGAVHVLLPQGRFATAEMTPRGLGCLTVITPARNPITAECVVFTDSCIPVGWVREESCQP